MAVGFGAARIPRYGIRYVSDAVRGDDPLRTALWSVPMVCARCNPHAHLLECVRCPAGTVPADCQRRSRRACTLRALPACALSRGGCSALRFSLRVCQSVPHLSGADIHRSQPATYPPVRRGPRFDAPIADGRGREGEAGSSAARPRAYGEGGYRRVSTGPQGAVALLPSLRSKNETAHLINCRII